MFSRFILLCFILLLSIPSSYAAECLDVFPSGWREQTPVNNQLINFPANGSTATLTDGTTLPRGDNLYLNETLGNQDEIFVGPVTGSETTARLFFRGSVSWQNVKINENGNPEDLIIIVDGSLQVTGDSTVINAIIYVKGSLALTDNATINGAVAVVGGSNNFPVNYSANYIINADFNGMCENEPELIAHYLFDEGTGQTTADSSGNGRTGTLGSSAGVDSNDPTWVCEANGYYLDFDRSSNQNVRTPSFKPPSEGTIAFWFKVPEAPTSRQRIFGFGDGYEIRWESNDIMYFDINKTGGNSSIRSNSAISITDTWVHIAFVTSVSNNTWSLYIDGILDNSGSETLSSQPSSSLTMGGSTWRLTSDHFTGSLEDFRIYSGNLTSTDIKALFESTKPESCNPFAAWWQFENDFLDSSSSNTNNLIPFNSPLFGQRNPGPANTIGNESTCSYVSFDGSNYASIDDSGKFNFQDLSVSTWVNPTAYSGIGLSSLVSKDEHFEFHLDSSGKLYWWWRTPDGTSHSLTSSATIPLNEWTHVAVVYDSSGRQYMYINGAIDQSANFTDGLANSPCDFYIGTDVATGSSTVCGQVLSDRNFQGHMDEVHIYDRVLSASEIAADLNIVHSCSLVGVDHYQIVHDGQGLTCEAENITIKACANATCSTLDNNASDVQLMINSTFDKTVTVTGGSTSTTISYKDPGIATLSLDETYECENGGSTSCDVVFTDAGFIFSQTTDVNDAIGNQIAGTPFTPYIRAVENVDGVCTGIFNGDVTVSLSQKNIEPTGSSGLTFTVDDKNATTKALGKHTDFTEVELVFDDESEATLTNATYLDAGQIQLYASYSADGVNLVGNSNAFWVSPAKLVVSAKSGAMVLNGATSSDTPTHKAGVPFEFTVTAYNSIGENAENITTNYTPKDIQLLLTRTGPTSGVDGSLNYGTGTVSSALLPTPVSVTLTAFNSGVSSTSSASYSEVGLLNLDVEDVDYGFADNIISAEAINIGRFTPDHFEQTVVEQGSLEGLCNPLDPLTSFVYTGQVLVDDDTKGALSYLTKPVVELTAKNVQGATTKNYTETDYMKLIASDNFIVKPVTDSVITGMDTNLLPLTANIYAGTVSHDGLVVGEPEFGLSLEAGVLHYELSDEDNFVYPRNGNAEINAQNNDIDFVIDQVNFIDSDGIGIESTVDITGTTGVNLRFGRAYLENSFGPETANLPQPFSVQYLNVSGKYAINTQDNCTTFDASEISLTSGTLDKNLTGVNTITSQLEEGETRAMLLTAPGAENQGTVLVEYEIYDWLKYDWTWNGVDAKVLDEKPSAVATFGLFRGNDRIIYQREVNN
jgi:hypothetical protein